MGAKFLNADFSIMGWEEFKSQVEALENGEAAAERVNGNLYEQSVARYAKLGLDEPGTPAANALGLAEWEKEMRNAFAIPSKRPGGVRGKGTGFIMPKTPKTYKSIMVSALEACVDLLNEDGFPRPLADVKKDISEAKPEKADEDKLMGAVETVVKIADKCNLSDPRTIAALDAMRAYLQSKGWM